MNPADTGLASDAYWQRVAAAASADEDFRAKSAHLRPLRFDVQIDAYRCSLAIDAGALRIDANGAPAFTIGGPANAWRALTSGKTVYGQAIHPVHGELRVSGDPLAATWANRPLWQLFRLTRALAASAEGGRHD